MIIQEPTKAIKKAKKLMTTHNKEHFIALYLNARNQCKYAEVISIGSINANLVHPREVFYPAIKKLITAIIVLHNHPSGGIEPSEADIEITKRLKHAGKILGIEVIDHIIFTKGDEYHSICRDSQIN